MSAYLNRDGSTKTPFVAGQMVKVVAEKDPDYGRTFQVMRVRDNAVWLPIRDYPRGMRFWSFEVEAV